ncbi:hypothetical protein PTTG_03983 [Puccinia triticina 1-1 BBBD Race 1]|uniref:Maintenance of telomere capping protein 1 n=1 Tax=Puccinia triticina (isolate 1-1 / race 1 (BBBD)) TaxID=630390 RepID=A0A180G9J9_PUCT1|nr:hypothetical protein PTTG_03983 [Puccinia triticina 1-1 BBBD Race 1]WAR58325.1 hypothetical protein PtB15_5B559 [Puccinia triticina]
MDTAAEKSADTTNPPQTTTYHAGRMADPAKQRPSHDQVLSILDDLDSFAPVPATPAGPNTASSTQPNTTKYLKTASNSSKPASSSPTTHPKGGKPSNNPASNSGDAQSVLDFIDEITQRSSTPTASIATKKLTSSRPVSRKPSTSSLGPRSADGRLAEPEPAPATTPLTSPTAPPSSSWGWGSVLKQATSSVLSQAKSAAGQVQSVVSDPSKSSEIVKSFNSNFQNQISGQSEAAKKWKEGVMGYVKASGIDQLGKDLQATGIKSLTDILNMVAPPISKHEIIDVQLSYDMVGYDGIETLVYRSLSKVMEQVDGGDLILNKGDEERPKPSESGEPERDLQAVEGMMEGYKLALANLEQMIKRIEAQKAELGSAKTEAGGSETKETTTTEEGVLPITHCPVYVRIQPILSRLPVFGSSAGPLPSTASGATSAEPAKGGVTVDQENHLFFLILLRDVKNSLDHATITQSTPATWLDIPFEENEWVEDVLVDVIRRGVEIIGQQYVNGRISGRSVRNTTNEDDQQQTEESSSSSKPVPSPSKPEDSASS